MEIWKEIKGFKGFYQVSSTGRVKSLYRKIIRSNGASQSFKERIIKTGIGSNGYPCAVLYKVGVRKSVMIHQLIAEAFLNHTPCGYRLVVDHQNGVRTDNRLENLQIITQRENSSKDKKGGISKHTGVTSIKSNNKWKARISINGKRKDLGSFDNELEAAEAYQTALKGLLCTK